MAEQPSFSDRIELVAHHQAIAEIQKRYGITPKGCIATQYPYSDDHLLVEGDGLGGGDLMVVCDHYPFDGYMQHHHHHFDDEDEACEAAAWFDQALEEGTTDMSATEFFELLKKGKKPWNEEEADSNDATEAPETPAN